MEVEITLRQREVLTEAVTSTSTFVSYNEIPIEDVVTSVPKEEVVVAKSDLNVKEDEDSSLSIASEFRGGS